MSGFTTLSGRGPLVLKTKEPVREQFLQTPARLHGKQFPEPTCDSGYLQHAALMTGKTDFKKIKRGCKPHSITEKEKPCSWGVTIYGGTPLTDYPSSK
jgi:hypothetical protein